jgi:hypothetical protein
MRFVVAGLLILHGALHLLGLQKGSARAESTAWVAACVTLLVAAGMLLLERGPWWAVAAAAVVLSQALVVGAWPVARAGTIVNVLLAIPIVVAAARAHFDRQTDELVLRLFAQVPSAAPLVVTRAELEPLPPPVRRWLEASGVVGRERARVVRLRQQGEMRTSPTGEWMPAVAQQYFTVDQPGFVWSVEVTMKHLLPVVGRDSYLGGHGRMLIKAAGLMPVVDGTGAKIDQGTLLRYLGEIVWFPSAALAPYIRWEPVDDSSAKATMTHAGVSAAGTFTFDAAGRMVRMSADRFQGSGPQAKLERWEVPAEAWRQMNGVLMPVEGRVIWKLATGDFDYYRWQITEVELNRPELYPRHGAARATAVTATPPTERKADNPVSFADRPAGSR